MDVMEFKTCEQYVLARLFELQNENERILADMRRMQSVIDDRRDNPND